jgi:hypothetical protein
LQSDDKASVYALDGDGFQLRVVPVSDQSFSCDFKFSSAQEMFDRTSAAIDLTMSHLAEIAPPKAR